MVLLFLLYLIVYLKANPVLKLAAFVVSASQDTVEDFVKMVKVTKGKDTGRGRNILF